MASDNNSTQDIRSMKRSMTLDLDPQVGLGQAGGGSARAKRLRSQFSNSPVLSSPDLNRFALASPEVEQFIKNNIQTAAATSSSSQPTPINVYLCPPKDITDRQAQFLKGFEDALAKVKQNEQGSNAIKLETATTVVGSSTNVPPNMSLVSSVIANANSNAPNTASSNLTTLTNLTAANLHTLNEQTGTVSAADSNCDQTISSDGIGSDTSDSMTTLKDEHTGVPTERINMGDQEMMKLERKRARNRAAASKCRRKKLERISQLQDQVTRLKNDNQEYEKLISLLKNEVTSLRQEVSIHRQHGCLIEI